MDKGNKGAVLFFHFFTETGNMGNKIEPSPLKNQPHPHPNPPLEGEGVGYNTPVGKGYKDATLP